MLLPLRGSLIAVTWRMDRCVQGCACSWAFSIRRLNTYFMFFKATGVAVVRIQQQILYTSSLIFCTEALEFRGYVWVCS